MREAFVQSLAEPARQQAAQLPDDVRDPVGHDLGRHPVGDGRGLPAAATSKVLRELGKNIGIVWGGRTSMQAGGERAGRADLADARRRARDRRASRRMVAVVSPELAARRRRGQERLQRRGAAACTASSRSIRTSARSSSSTGRQLHAGRTRSRSRASRSSASTWPSSCSASATSSARRVTLNGMPLHGRRQDPQEGPGQQLQRARQQQDLRAVRGDGADLPRTDARARHRCRTSSSRRSRGSSTQLPRVLDARTGRIEDIDWPLERERPRDPGAPPRLRSRRSRGDRDVGHVAQTLMFGRMIDHMKRLLHHRRHRHAGARRHRRDEHHAGRRQGADARDRRPQGARRDDRAASSGSSSSKASS